MLSELLLGKLPNDTELRCLHGEQRLVGCSGVATFEGAGDEVAELLSKMLASQPTKRPVIDVVLQVRS